MPGPEDYSYGESFQEPASGPGLAWRWWLLAFVVGFWVCLFLLAEFTDAVPGRGLASLFFLIALTTVAASVAAMVLLLVAKSWDEHEREFLEELERNGQDQDRDGQGGDDSDAQ